MEELRIPLPTASGGRVPQTLSYRWCKALHEALQPLTKYKVMDGSEAFSVLIAFGYQKAVFLSEPFDEEHAKTFSDFDEGVKASERGTPYPGSLVCEISMCASAGAPCYSDILRIYLVHFSGDAKGAQRRFEDVVAHIEEHCLPQVGPQWIDAALAALKQ